MSEDLHTNIENYKLQLQQVEAALVAESENEELKKLKADLEEVIKITQELLQSSADGTPVANGNDPPIDDPKPVKEWKVGDRCMAVWSKNNQLYEAVIDGISEGKAAVTFVGYNVTEINKLYQLRICEQTQPKKYLWDTKPKAKSQWQVEKERRRKKALKKFQRLKQIEEDKEAEKNKWKEFTAKA
ncbi:unnamed protein product, partial [Soboliphyme baturini]|uniref:Tudor domain-containing protein n=1 Tax=Soboliphyme baturini TaxID=241478 RepID=A0A183IKK4_9BILA